MCVNSYEYACLIDQFWFEYGLHVSSSRIQIFESLFVHSFHAHLSRMHAPSGSYHSLFSSSPARSLHVSPIHANMVSRRLPWEVSHSPYHYTLHGFIISHVSTVLWYHSVPKLSFSPPNTQSPLVFHFVFLSMGFSHTPYMSLHMTHTTKITLSLSTVDTTFVMVSFSSPSQTDIIHLFTDQTTPTTVSSLSLSQTHTHNSCFHSPSRLPSLSHTQNSHFRTPTRISLTNIYRLASL